MLLILIIIAYIVCVCVCLCNRALYTYINICAPILDAVAPTVFMVLLWAYSVDRESVNATQQKAIRIMVGAKQRECCIELFKRFCVLPHTSVCVLLLPSFVVYSMVEIQTVNLTFMYKDLTQLVTRKCRLYRN